MRLGSCRLDKIRFPSSAILTLNTQTIVQQILSRGFATLVERHDELERVALGLGKGIPAFRVQQDDTA